MSIKRTQAPASAVLTIGEAQTHLRVDDGSFMAAPTAPTVAVGVAVGSVDAGSHSYAVTYITTEGQTQLGDVATVTAPGDKAIVLTGIPLGAPNTLARWVYRTEIATGDWWLLRKISDNTTTTLTDTVADNSLDHGIAGPTFNSTGSEQLALLVEIATEQAESITRRALISQSWLAVMDEFPRPGMSISSANWYGPQWGTQPGPLSMLKPDGTTGFEIYLPLPPLQTVDSISYYDQSGIKQTLASSAYIVDAVSEPARIMPAPNTTWPATQSRANAVEIAFTCGYGAAADVPAGIKSWILMRVGSLYEHREELALMNRGKIEPLPFVDRLLDPYRVVKF